MRKSMLLLLLSATVLTASAQKSKGKARLSETSVVKDTAGHILPAEQWIPLYEAGKVKVEPVTAASAAPEFVLSRYSDAEWAKLMESIPKPVGSKAFKKGKSLTPFSVTDLEGNRWDLSALKGKVVVLNFWFINCPPCRLEIPDLNELVDQYEGNKEVVFLGIALDDQYRLQEFLKVMPFRYHLIEDGRELAMSNNIAGFPTHVVLDREGKVLFHTDGLARNTVYWIKKSIEQGLAK